MAPHLLELPPEILERITEYTATLPDDPTGTLTRIERRTPELLSWRLVNRHTRDHVRHLQDHPTTERDTPLGVRYISDMVKFTLGHDWRAILEGWDATVKQNVAVRKPVLADLLPEELGEFKKTSHIMMTELHWTSPTYNSFMGSRDFSKFLTNSSVPHYSSQGRMLEAVLGVMASDPDLLPHLQRIIINDRILLTDDNSDEDKRYISALISTNLPLDLRNWTATNFKNSAWRMEMLQGAMMIGKSQRDISVCATLDNCDRKGMIHVDTFPRSLTLHANQQFPRFNAARRRKGQDPLGLTAYYSIRSIDVLDDLESGWSKNMDATPMNVTAHFKVDLPPIYTDEEAEQFSNEITTEILDMAVRLNQTSVFDETGSSIQVTVNDENVPSCKLCGRTFFSWERTQ